MLVPVGIVFMLVGLLGRAPFRMVLTAIEHLVGIDYSQQIPLWARIGVGISHVGPTLLLMAGLTCVVVGRRALFKN